MDEQSWPGGRRHALTQDEHREWNTQHYPGTRQLCSTCGEPTGQCEEDTIKDDEGNPICEVCKNTPVKIIDPRTQSIHCPYCSSNNIYYDKLEDVWQCQEKGCGKVFVAEGWSDGIRLYEAEEKEE